MKRTTPKRFLRSERRAERSTPTSLSKREWDGVRQVALRTWSGIAHDIFNALEEQGESVEMTRDDVIETVLDADYMEHLGQSSSEERDALAKFRELSYNEQKVALRAAFPFAAYVR